MKKNNLFFLGLQITQTILCSGGTSTPPEHETLSPKAISRTSSQEDWDRDDEAFPAGCASSRRFTQDDTALHNPPLTEEHDQIIFYRNLGAWVMQFFNPEDERRASVVEDDGCAWDRPNSEALQATLQKMSQTHQAESWLKTLQRYHTTDKARAAMSETGSLDVILSHNKRGTLAKFLEDLPDPGTWLATALNQANDTENLYKIVKIIDIINTYKFMDQIPPAYQQRASIIIVGDMQRSCKDRLPTLQITTGAHQAAHSDDPTISTQRQLLKAMTSVHRNTESDSEDDEKNYTDIVEQLAQRATQLSLIKQERRTRQTLTREALYYNPTPPWRKQKEQ